MWKDWRKPRKTTVVIPTEHRPNARLQRWPYANLDGKKEISEMKKETKKRSQNEKRERMRWSNIARCRNWWTVQERIAPLSPKQHGSSAADVLLFLRVSQLDPPPVRWEARPGGHTARALTHSPPSAVNGGRTDNNSASGVENLYSQGCSAA